MAEVPLVTASAVVPLPVLLLFPPMFEDQTYTFFNSIGATMPVASQLTIQMLDLKNARMLHKNTSTGRHAL